MTHARASLHVGHDIVILRIGVTAARQLLQVPLSELTDLTVPLEEINRSLARELAERFETGRLVESFAQRALTTADTRFAAAARRLARGCSVQAAAAVVALSERQLERLFNDQAGVTPKMFARIVRFRRAIIAARQGTSLAEAAAAHGYADQSHFTREVRALTDRSPRSLLPDVASVQDATSWRNVGCE